MKYKSSLNKYASGIIAIPVPDTFSLDNVFGIDSDDEDFYDPGSGYAADILVKDTELELEQSEVTKTVENEINVVEVTETEVTSVTAVTFTTSASSTFTSYPIATTQSEMPKTSEPSKHDQDSRSGTSMIANSLQALVISILFSIWYAIWRIGDDAQWYNKFVITLDSWLVFRIRNEANEWIPWNHDFICRNRCLKVLHSQPPANRVKFPWQ